MSDAVTELSIIAKADAEVASKTYVVCRECGHRSRSDGAPYVDDDMVKAGMVGAENSSFDAVKHIGEYEVRAILQAALSASGEKK